MLKEEIWIEKYRPKRLDDVVGQTEVLKRLKSYVRSRNLPHLLLSGPPGVGKTASAVCIARELFEEAWTNNFTELNASDERGIDVVRNKIKNFARTAPLGEAEFKIIFLDEADALTSDAQSALRRTMEKYTATCRFILSCNYSSKIIEPIQSRCAVYRFKPIGSAAVEERIRHIARAEGVNLTDDGMDAVKYVASGDMRRAINALQAAAMLDKTVNMDAIYKTTATAKPEEVVELIKLGLEGNFMKARAKLDYLLIEQGLSGEDIIGQIYRAMFDMTIPDKLKVDLIDRIGEIDFRMAEGANERIQLEALIAHFMLCGANKK
ncbi:MAG: replication factor C small subunit [Candidatus Methanoperedens sp.]|nr:replication factor C small subunit [Candidatus Methanoperedens sp.]